MAPSGPSAAEPSIRYAAGALRDAAHAMLTRLEMRDDIARDVAAVLVEGDLLGHNTHGLALLPSYLAEVEKGSMTKLGSPIVQSARPAAECWDGQRLPGPWLTLRALDAAMAMASIEGTGTVVIKRSHHIACLAAYLRHATRRDMMALIYCSDPSNCSVAPFGAVTPVFTPNPLAAGIPTSGEPILLDISASYTTNGLTARLHQQNQKLPHPFVQDANGQATDDPGVLFGEPRGTLLPLGGLEAGHKGFALGLLIEAMTAALSGHGRADPAEGWGATVFVQVLDPGAFGGTEGFLRQMDWLVNACHDAKPRPGGPRVRMPGERGLALYRDQHRNGVLLHPSILPSLVPWAEKLDVSLPQPLKPASA